MNYCRGCRPEELTAAQRALVKETDELNAEVQVELAGYAADVGTQSDLPQVFVVFDDFFRQGFIEEHVFGKFEELLDARLINR